MLFNILREKPIDNPIIEALNGWIKKELFLDFSLSASEYVPSLLNDYVEYFNYEYAATVFKLWWFYLATLY